MTRVLYVSAADTLGGAEASLYTLLSALDRSVVEPHLVVPEGDTSMPAGERLSECASALDVPVHVLPLARLKNTWFPVKMLSQWRRCHALRDKVAALAARLEVDLVHANSATAALQSAGPRLLVHLRDLRLPAAAGASIGARAEVVIATSQAVAEMARRVVGPRVRRVANGVDLTQFRPGRSGAIGADPYVLMIGHLVPWKRHRLFLDVLAEIRSRIPGIRGVIAGSDLFGEHARYIEGLKRYAADLGLTHAVDWRENVPFAEMPALLSGASVLIHPAEREPFGRSIIEAMACETPVVAADASGPAEILTQGGGGLVPVGATQAFAAAVLVYLRDPLKAQAVGERGRHIVEEYYAADLSARMIERIYREVGE